MIESEGEGTKLMRKRIKKGGDVVCLIDVEKKKGEGKADHCVQNKVD